MEHQLVCLCQDFRRTGKKLLDFARRTRVRHEKHVLQRTADLTGAHDSLFRRRRDHINISVLDETGANKLRWHIIPASLQEFAQRRGVPLQAVDDAEVEIARSPRGERGKKGFSRLQGPASNAPNIIGSMTATLGAAAGSRKATRAHTPQDRKG